MSRPGPWHHLRVSDLGSLRTQATLGFGVDPLRTVLSAQIPSPGERPCHDGAGRPISDSWAACQVGYKRQSLNSLKCNNTRPPTVMILGKANAFQCFSCWASLPFMSEAESQLWVHHPGHPRWKASKPFSSCCPWFRNLGAISRCTVAVSHLFWRQRIPTL